jgi:hypothetical protein
MSHPSLGLPPRDMMAGLPQAAERMSVARERLAGRALEVAFAGTPTMQDRYDEPGQRQLLRDAELLVDRLALSLASGDPYHLRAYADMVSPVYRRRRIPLDDLIDLCEGIRAALPGTLTPDELEPAGVALDEAIEVFRWHRRLAGDARKKNAFLQFLYKGA